MHRIRLSPLEKEDCEAVAMLAGRTLPEHITKDMLEDTLRYKYNHFFVAKDGDSIVGFTGMMILADEAELLYIAVEESYKRKGIGTRLMDAVFYVLEKHFVWRLLLEVRKSNETAQKFYKTRGFRIMGERKNYYSHPTEDALIMEWVRNMN